MRMWTRAVLIGAIGLAAGGAVGCAEEREPINRVQANTLAKSFFVGEDFEDTSDDPAFYARVVITDVGYGAATDGLFTSTYAQNPTVIKWEITEDLLLGRIVYNRIENADSHGDGPSSIDGQLAYAFPIISHFDIRRDYNPTTGEEGNVIVENTSDRVWDEREYFRVDWSRNLNVDAYDFDTLSLLGVYGGVTYEPLSYYVTDPAHPDAPHFATDQGYFDVTTKAFATPGLIDLSHFGWGIDSFPACFLPNDFLGGSWPFGNCNPTEITLRMAFRRVEASDYEPVDWSGDKFTQFGIFYGERFGYARNYGIVDDNWHRFAARYNIWEKHHAYLPQSGNECPSGWVPSADFPGECEMPCYTSEKTLPGEDPTRDCGNDVASCRGLSVDDDEIVGNGTADECEAVTAEFGAGSQCDKFKQKCTLPYAKRTPAPVVWHFTKGSNTGHYIGTEWASHEWDVAMRTAVRTAQLSECIATQTGSGTDLATAETSCQGQFPMYTGQQNENEDAIALAREVDDCRSTIGAWANEGPAGAWTEDRIAYCDGQADSIGNARGYSAGVISIAKMGEMVTLCHGPVEATDNPLCVQDIQRLMSDKGKAADKRAVLPADITSADCDAAWQAEHDSAATVDQAVLETCNNGFFARMGDIRFHQVNVIRTPQTPSPWGIMVDADDPRTGEKIHASVNVWSHVTDLATQGHIDTIRYINGEIDTDEITDGTYVRDWARAADAASGKGALGTMDRHTVERRKFAAVDGRTFDNGVPHVDADEAASRRKEDVLDPQIVAKSREFFKQHASKIKADANTISVNRPYTDARRMAAQNTPTEAALINDAMMQLGGLNQAEIKAAQNEGTAGSLGSPYLASSSILRTLNPQVHRDMRQARELGLAARGHCILDDDHIMNPAPNTYAALGEVLQRKFEPFNPADSKDVQLARAEKMRQYLVQRYEYSVMIHEMGHSIGHRHNFVSSYFAFGFRPQYWQLRTKDGTLTTECDDVSPDGENCVGPRYFDPPTQTESDNLIWMWHHSSVMDYPGELSQDMLGLGAYDFAAARMFYGQSVAVHADLKNGVKGANNDTLLNISDTFGGIVGYQYVKKGGDSMHYTGLQEQLELISDCAEVDPAAFQPKNWDERLGNWDSLVDGLIVTQNGTATRCKTPAVSYMPYHRMRGATPNETANAGFYGGLKRSATVDQHDRLRVPYGFATDSWADLGNLSVYRHDNGADPYELFNFLITEQETRHIFDNYRRQRTSFSVRTQANRILGRYNEKMRDGAKGLGLFNNIYREFFAQLGVDFNASWPFYANLFFPDNLLASGVAFDHFTWQFQRPETGGHYAYDNWQTPLGAAGLTQQDMVWRSVHSLFENPDEETGSDFYLFDGATGKFGQVLKGAKLVENRLGDGNGEFDRDYQINAGSYYDKVYAPFLLTESVDNFISDSLTDFTDPRYRSVSMADMFPDGYRRFLANNLTGDDFIKGARIAANPPAQPTQRPNPILDSDGFPELGIAATSWWTPQPEVCFPGENGIVCSVYGCPTGTVCEATQTGTINPTPLNPLAPAATTVVEAQVDWEEWKFLIAQTLIYLPENQKTNWIDMMGIWEIGADTDPEFDNRIELHLPDGRIYVARTYGTEQIFGKTVQRGVGARILEYANDLMRAAYEGTEFTGTYASWYIPTLKADGSPWIKFDPRVSPDGPGNGQICNAADSSGCTCTSNRACNAIEKYKSLPAFMRQSMRDFRMADASMKGIYD